MILLRMWTADIAKFSPARFEDLVRRLAVTSTPMLQSVLAKYAEVLGVELNELQMKQAGSGDFSFASGPDRVDRAEVFLTGDQAFVIAVRTKRRGSASRPPGTPRDAMRLWVYSIGANAEHPELSTIHNAVQEVFGVALTPHYYHNDRFDELRNEARALMSPPSEADVGAAYTLHDRDTRSLAVAIKSSLGLLVGDLPKQLPHASREDVDSIKSRLESAGLVASEVVLICRRTQSQIARLPHSAAISEVERTGLKCACGRPISEERTEQALTVTDLGRQLLDKSRWLSVLVSRELQLLGVPGDRILLEFEAGGDEIDCIAEISGELVFFELKDKEFSLGNAYSFGAKMGIIRPRNPVIVTTETVASDARDHFDKSRQAGRRSAYGWDDPDMPRPVVYIEGIENLRSGLQGVANEIYQSDAARVLNMVLNWASLAPRSIFDVLERKQGAAAE